MPKYEPEGTVPVVGDRVDWPEMKEKPRTITAIVGQVVYDDENPKGGSGLCDLSAFYETGYRRILKRKVVKSKKKITVAKPSQKYEPDGTVAVYGDRVTVIQKLYGHKFDIGETVKKADDGSNGFLRYGEKFVSGGYMRPEEYRVHLRKTKRPVLTITCSASELTGGPKETILEEAQRLTSVDRNADYGHPLDDYSKTGMIWGALLHKWSIESAKSKTPIPVPPELACLCMTGVKLSREVNKSKRDNLVDGAGYLRLVEMIQVEREKRNGK